MSLGREQAYDAASKFYDHRLPYDPRLFEGLAARLDLGPEDTILDICCGLGQISVGLAGGVKQVLGVDFSEGMLALAPRRANVRYLRHDINDLPLPEAIAGQRFDQFVIGRAIHWVSPEALASVIGSSLKPGGGVTTCGAGWLDTTPWLAAFTRLRKSYAPGAAPDARGRSAMAAQGFVQSDEVRVAKVLWCDFEFLVKHALSYGRSGPAIAGDLDTFRSRLADVLAPYAVDGLYRGEAVSWGVTFRA